MQGKELRRKYSCPEYLKGTQNGRCTTCGLSLQMQCTAHTVYVGVFISFL
uniref:Uncharacterized protein n=1 Tax=Anguilla anguilla TaxID=7936 RepID=A0A0E9VFC0_ANGAN